MTESVDLTLVIRKANGQLTVSTLPKSNGLKDEAANHIIPLTLTGTPEEMDAEFLQHIMQPIRKATGLISNLMEFEKQADKAAANSKAAKDAKAKEKKPQASAAPFETPKVRIISRPAPAPARPQQQRNERDGERRGGGRGRDGRDGRDNTRDNDRQQRTPRDAGGRSDDNRQRRSGGGQGRPGGARPQGGAPRAGDMMGFGPADNDSRSGQSKKKRNKGRRTVDFQQMGFDAHDENEAPRMRSTRSRKKKQVQAPAQVTQPLKAAKRKVRVEGGTIRVSDMAHQMGLKANELIKVLFNLGIMATINQSIDFDTASILASEFSYEVERTGFEEKDYLEDSTPDRPEDLKPRPPVVTIMGHVDHGKTSLLDAIRKTHVTSGEAGGITQHIGAYHVTLEDGRQITFLDTPGHEAFTAMRARGAKVTDVVIVIVAADDNVMPQTKEAINHAMAAGVPIVFAINKIDKPAANPDKIKEELANMNYLVEEWGGKYQSQDISAKKGIGVNELLEKVLLEAEMLDLKANPNRRATGSIIESSLDKGRGYVATVLVSNGTLKVGDIVLAGTHYGKVKAMFNERNQRMKQAGPSEPALILGLNGAPAAGDTFHVIETEQEAREIANKREQLQREQGLRTQKMLTLDEVGRRLALGDFHELNIIVKGDVDGSVEALSDSLIKLSTEQIQVNVIHKGVGQISESDVSLAAASDAIIVGFQVRPSSGAAKLAEQEGVDIRKYSIIYDAIEEVKAAMEGMLAPTLKEQVTATIEVREVFNISKVGQVAGAMVKTGKVKRTDKARLIRDGIVVYTGAINALKRFKDDVKEVGTNFECGISLTNCNDIKVGDVIETYEEVEVKQTL